MKSDDPADNKSMKLHFRFLLLLLLVVSASLVAADEMIHVVPEATYSQKTDMPQIGAIVIDPGHGGKDSGATGVYEIDGTQTKLAEKDIALTVAKDLYTILKDKYPEKTIQLTRTDDRYPSLEERADLANTIPRADNEIVLYISLHVNASANKSTSGFETWCLSPEYRSENNTGVTSTENMLLAQSISDGLNAGIGSEMTSRGIKTEDWYIARNTQGPSALVELGFLTNLHDAQLLSDPEFIHKTVLGISNGIGSFITVRENGTALTTGDGIAADPQKLVNVTPEPITPFDFSISWPVKVKEAHNMEGKLGGVRLTAEKGEPVKSVTTGTVISAGPYRGFGHAVLVQTGDGYSYVYAGCESLRVKAGEKVSPGTELGYVGIDPLSEKPQLFFLVYRFGSPEDPDRVPRS